jgi:hypothetical protein
MDSFYINRSQPREATLSGRINFNNTTFLLQSDSQEQMKTDVRNKTGYGENWGKDNKCNSCLVMEDLKLRGHKATISNPHTPISNMNFELDNKYEAHRGNLEEFKHNKLRMNVSEVFLFLII